MYKKYTCVYVCVCVCVFPLFDAVFFLSWHTYTHTHKRPTAEGWATDCGGVHGNKGMTRVEGTYIAGNVRLCAR